VSDEIETYAMSDQPFYAPDKRPAPARQPQPGELLFEFHVEQTHYRVELRDHGPVYGVEAQFLDPIDPIMCRTFRPNLDPTRTPRELAIQWAEAERVALEADGGVAP
jgi:hypothetical protein